jgi:NADPH-dependent glutamate synthase beta subunit-like oxidoreductase
MPGIGDTGADCLGTWPLWPLMLRAESSHEEGGIRDWAISTTHFSGDDHGNVSKLHAIRVAPPPKFEPIPGTEFTLEAGRDACHRRRSAITEGRKAARGVDQWLMGETTLPQAN